MNIVDLTGQRFGHLTVLRRLDERRNGQVCWLCQCTCGNQSVVSSGNLRSGGTKSCGCQRNIRRFEDLTGRVFGNLTVLCRAGKSVHGAPLWLCQCVCGNLHTTTTGCLTSGSSKSCGCLKHKANRIYLINDVGICLIAKGGYFWFDCEDVELVEKYEWYEHKGYARIRRDNKFIWFHRAVLGVTDAMFIDHINGDRHDNRKCNLRICTHQQNMCHKSNIKGYSCLANGTYRAQIMLNGKTIPLGVYATEEEAHAAYLGARHLYHGEFCSYDDRIIYCP